MKTCRNSQVAKSYIKISPVLPLVLLIITIAFVPQASAAFSKIYELDLLTEGNHHGLAYDGSNWHIADPFRDIFKTYDSSFNYIKTVTVSGVDDMRGMTYDRNSGHLFVGDNSSGIVREVTLEGAEIQQFGTGSSLNALAYDAVTDSIWSAHFSGMIENRTRTGALISSFNGGQRWTGLALDEINNTLILLEDNDTFYEFNTDGTLIGQIISTDLLDGNGQGLAYDSFSGTLWATSQYGRVTIFQDAGRVPEPATICLLGLGASSLLRRKR
jgi:hypothetical protein